MISLDDAAVVSSPTSCTPRVCDVPQGSSFAAEIERNLNLPGIDGLGTPFTSEDVESPKGRGLPNRASGASSLENVQPWDVSHGPRAEGMLDRLTMVVPAVTRFVTTLVGGTLATGGYAAGKVGETIGVGKAIDSTVFRAGFLSWMWSNGIFPTVQYLPLGEAEEALLRLNGPSVAPLRDDDMSITPLIVSNHICYLDGLVLAAVFGAPKVVAMAGARQAPVFGKLMEEMEVVFVDRQQKDSRQATLDAIAGHCADWAPGKRPLLIFAEGTTTNGEELKEFKRGAFISGKPVRPVLLVYTGQWDPATTTYRTNPDGDLSENSDMDWGAQFMGHFIHSIHVQVYPPYVPNEEERSDPKVYAENCNKYMAAQLAVLREELRQRSWKEAAGRENGGLGYKAGDFVRVGLRKFASGFSVLGEALNCAGPRRRIEDEEFFIDSDFERRTARRCAEAAQQELLSSSAPGGASAEPIVAAAVAS